MFYFCPILVLCNAVWSSFGVWDNNKDYICEGMPSDRMGCEFSGAQAPSEVENIAIEIMRERARITLSLL